MLLSIIIINYNTTKHLLKCLDSIKQQLKSIEKEIIVADNNSPDREIESLANNIKDVKFLFRKSNDGFGTACNDAVEISTGEYLLFLNPDVILFDDSIKRMVERIEKDKEAGVYSGLLVNSEKKPIYCFNDFPDIEWEFYQFLGFGYDHKIKQLLSRAEISQGNPFNTDWFHGAFLLIKRCDFQIVKGFDEKYFMYYEDVELCYKIKTVLGKKNVCFPDVRIYHHTQSSIENETTDDIFIFHMHRGKLIFINSYGFIKKMPIYFLGLSSIILRMMVIPFVAKFKGKRKSKLTQLKKILKLYLSKKYLNISKYEYINS